MTAARKLEREPYPALAALRRLGPEQRAELDRALAEIDAGRVPSVIDPDVATCLGERLRQEEQGDELDDLTPEELAELERRCDAADQHPETLVPLADVLAMLSGS